MSARTPAGERPVRGAWSRNSGHVKRLAEPVAAGRALSWAGGGPSGIAWETGVLAGLAAGGADVTAADYVLGTSPAPRSPPSSAAGCP